jgi:hypothetical protein
MRAKENNATHTSMGEKRRGFAPPGRPAVRYVLGGLLIFGALNAFGGGYYGLSGAEGVPVEWLSGSPSEDYFIPRLMLFVVVGGAFLVAAIAVFARFRIGRVATFGAGATVLMWLGVEVAIIGCVFWMQPATAVGGVLVLVLAWMLPQAETVSPLAQGQDPDSGAAQSKGTIRRILFEPCNKSHSFEPPAISEREIQLVKFDCVVV